MKKKNVFLKSKIGRIAVIVKRGNVALEDVGCIIVPQFSDHAHYGGTGYAVCFAGMSKGVDAYNEAACEKPLAHGDEMLIPSGKDGVVLAHVAVIDANKGEQFYAVVKGVLQSLISAESYGATTVAVPLLGNGVEGSLSPSQSAKAILFAVENFNTIRNGETTIKEVRLALIHSFDTVQKVLAEKAYHDAKPEKGQKEFDLCGWIKQVHEQLNA